MKPQAKLFYLRNKYGNIVAVVASTLHDGNVYYAVSCHNKQDQFNPEVGRALAVGRLFLGDCRWAPADTGVKVTILKQIAHDTSLSQRARDAARLWLKKLAKKPAATKVEPVILQALQAQ